MAADFPPSSKWHGIILSAVSLIISEATSVEPVKTIWFTFLFLTNFLPVTSP